MSSLAFTVYGSPVAQPRQRHRVIQAAGRACAHNYTPAKAPVNQWKSDIKAAAIGAFGERIASALWAGPVCAHIVVYFPRPKKFMRRRDPDGLIPHISKPDRDNVEKAILDALKGVVFVDDCQVCDGSLKKFYHEKTGRPRAEIRLEEIAL